MIGTHEIKGSLWSLYSLNIILQDIIQQELHSEILKWDDLLKPSAEKSCCIFWTISANKGFSNLYVSVQDIHLKQLIHLEWNFLIYKKSYRKALGWWQERELRLTLLIQLQNLNFIMAFQINRSFNKSWDRSLSLNNSFIYTSEFESLKNEF